MSFLRFRPKNSSRRAVKYGLLCIFVVVTVVYFWADLCLWRADASLLRHDTRSATIWVDRSRWGRPTVDARTVLLQLRIARRSGDFHEVERLLQRAAQQGVPRRDIQRQRWLAMAQTNQFAQMEAYWSDLLSDPREDGPDIARAYYTWSMLHHNLALAEKTLTLWHLDYPRDPEPLNLLGRFHQSQFDWKEAEDAYRRALLLAPNDDEIRLAYANALQVQLKMTEAIPVYEDFRRRNPDNLLGIQGLAHCIAATGDSEQAVKLLELAIEKDPHDVATQKAYGEALLSTGNASAAVPVLEKAFQSLPEHANLAYSLARALKACGRNDEAKPLFEFVSKSRQELDEMLHLEKELRADPDNLDLRMKIAAITAKYVSRQDGIRWYENLLRIAPHYAPAHEALVDLYQQQGDTRLAEFHANQLHRTVMPSKPDVVDAPRK